MLRDSTLCISLCNQRESEALSKAHIHCTWTRQDYIGATIHSVDVPCISCAFIHSVLYTGTLLRNVVLYAAEEGLCG